MAKNVGFMVQCVYLSLSHIPLSSTVITTDDYLVNLSNTKYVLNWKINDTTC